MRPCTCILSAMLLFACGIQPVVGARRRGGEVSVEIDLCDDIEGRVHAGLPELGFLGPDGDCDDDGIANRSDRCPGVSGEECQLQIENCRAIERDTALALQYLDLRGCQLSLATSTAETVKLTGDLLCATIEDSGHGAIELENVLLRRVQVRSQGAVILRNAQMSESSLQVAHYQVTHSEIASSALESADAQSTVSDSTFRGCNILQQPLSELSFTRTAIEQSTLRAASTTESTRLRLRSSTVTDSLVVGFEVDWTNVQTRGSEAAIAGGNIAASMLHSSRIESQSNLLIYGSRVGVGPRDFSGEPAPTVLIGPDGHTTSGQRHPAQLRIVGGEVHNTRMRAGHIFVQDASVDQSAVFGGSDFYGVRAAMRASTFCEATRVHLQGVAIGAGTTCNEPFLASSCSDSTIVAGGSCRPLQVFASCGDLHREEPPAADAP